MEDWMRKFMYAGVGLLAMTAERMQESIEEMVNRGKLTQKEGKKMMDELFDSTDAKREVIENRLKETAEQVAGRFSFPTRAEVEALHARIAELEARLAGQSRTAEMPAEEAAAPAPRKSRGRRSSSEKAEAATLTQTPKRGRGRPKAQPAEGLSNDPARVEAPAAAPKGRGRRAKTAQAPADNSKPRRKRRTKAEMEADRQAKEAAGPRRRGRPAKKPEDERIDALVSDGPRRATRKPAAAPASEARPSDEPVALANLTGGDAAGSGEA